MSKLHTLMKAAGVGPYEKTAAPALSYAGKAMGSGVFDRISKFFGKAKNKATSFANKPVEMDPILSKFYRHVARIRPYTRGNLLRDAAASTVPGMIIGGGLSGLNSDVSLRDGMMGGAIAAPGMVLGAGFGGPLGARIARRLRQRFSKGHALNRAVSNRLQSGQRIRSDRLTKAMKNEFEGRTLANLAGASLGAGVGGGVGGLTSLNVANSSTSDDQLSIPSSLLQRLNIGV